MSVDPHADRYPWISSYAYCNNNPIVLKDPDGKDGVAVVNTSTKTITLTAKYFVVTEPLKGSDRHIPIYTTAYSKNEISGMQSSINNQLNNANYQVTEGEYSGYNVKFNLEFVDGGSRFNAQTSAEEYTLGGIPAGNLWEKRGASTDNEFMPKENGSVTGGYVLEKKYLRMNSKKDFKRERIHEIFHTLFFNNDNAESGIGNYNPGTDMPNQSDINTLINNSQLPKVNEKPKE